MILTRRALALLVAPSLVACDAAYEAPCRIARRELLVDEEPRALYSLRRSRDRVVAEWATLELRDGSAEPALSLTGFQIVEIDERGGLVRRFTIAAPEELRARAGSVDAAEVVVEDGARLVYWTETVTTTDADGRVRNAAALRAAYEGGPVVSSPRAACERCKLRVAFASRGSESVAIVRTEPDLASAMPLGAAAPAPAFVAMRFRRDGTSVEELPWLSIPRSPGPADGGLTNLGGAPSERALSLETDADERLVLVTDGHAWLLDQALLPLGGPVALPSSDGRIAWSSTGEASVAWSESPFEEGRTTEPFFSRREVFTGLVPNGATHIAARERVSRGRALLAADRRGDETGVLFESAGRTFFAALDARGNKRGGDLLVSTDGDPTRASEYGPFVPQRSNLLVARGGGGFTTVTLGARSLASTEIVCAP